MLSVLCVFLMALSIGGPSDVKDICFDKINCPVEAKMGNPTDCSSYFLCRDTSLYLEHCPLGLEYDIVKYGCMDPSKSRHCQPTCPDNSYEKYVVNNDKSTRPLELNTTFTPENPCTSASCWSSTHLTPGSKLSSATLTTLLSSTPSHPPTSAAESPSSPQQSSSAQQSSSSSSSPPPLPSTLLESSSSSPQPTSSPPPSSSSSSSSKSTMTPTATTTLASVGATSTTTPIASTTFMTSTASLSPTLLSSTQSHPPTSAAVSPSSSAQQSSSSSSPPSSSPPLPSTSPELSSSSLPELSSSLPELSSSPPQPTSSPPQSSSSSSSSKSTLQSETYNPSIAVILPTTSEDASMTAIATTLASVAATSTTTPTTSTTTSSPPTSSSSSSTQSETYHPSTATILLTTTESTSTTPTAATTPAYVAVTATTTPIASTTFLTPTTSFYPTSSSHMTSITVTKGMSITPAGFGLTSAVNNLVRDPCSDEKPPCSMDEVMPNPIYCKNYFTCNSEHKWELQACFEGLHFDTKSGRCINVNESSAVCQKQCTARAKLTLDMLPALNHVAEDTEVKFECSFRLHDSFMPAQLKSMKWLKNGKEFRNGSKNIVIVNEGRDNKGLWRSRMTFKGIKPRHSGMITCRVEYKNGTYIDAWGNMNGTATMEKDSIYFLVVALPRVFLNPLTLTTLGSKEFKVLCSFEGSAFNVSYEWFVNGTSSRYDGNFRRQESFYGSTRIETSTNSDLILTCSVCNYSVACSNRSAFIYHLEEDDRYCSEETLNNVKWSLARAGTTSISKCSAPQRGSLERQCSTEGRWQAVNNSKCVEGRLLDLKEELEDLSDYITEPDSNDQFEKWVDILNETKVNTTVSGAEKILDIITLLLDNIPPSMNDTTALESIMDIVDNMIIRKDDNFLATLLQKNASILSQFLSDMETLGMSLAKRQSLGSSKTFNYTSMIMTVFAYNTEDQGSITFPSPEQDFLFLEEKSFVSPIGGNDSEKIYMSFISYKSLETFLPLKDNKTVNSSILSAVVDSVNPLRHPARFYYKSLRIPGNDKNGHCSYWNMTRHEWSEDGCELVTNKRANSSHCQCSHLTNFALLMSLSQADGYNYKILSIISIIGCVISIVSMILTLVIFGVRWKKIRSHHLVVIINLCVALIIANIVFLAGVDRTDCKAGCIVVAVLLHFFYLAGFFMMLAEGVELLFYVVFVFHVKRKRELVALLVLAWICPIIIVAITLGVTKTEGYTSDKSCWLSLEHGVIWAFVGPVLFVILANMIILAVVVVRVTGAKRPVEKDKARHRLKAALWSILVLTPVLGLTWVFGVLSVSKETIAFQYIFAVVNSLQGFFIFLFHGLRNRKEKPKYKYSMKDSTSSNQARQRAAALNRTNRLASHSTSSTAVSSPVLIDHGLYYEGDSSYANTAFCDDQESNVQPRRAWGNQAILPYILEERGDENQSQTFQAGEGRDFDEFMNSTESANSDPSESSTFEFVYNAVAASSQKSATIDPDATRDHRPPLELEYSIKQPVKPLSSC